MSVVKLKARKNPAITLAFLLALAGLVLPFSGLAYIQRGTNAHLVPGRRVHRVILSSPGMSAELDVRMIRDNQEIVLAPGESDYEGLGWVKGMLNGRYVEGTTFTELVNDSSHL